MKNHRRYSLGYFSLYLCLLSVLCTHVVSGQNTSSDATEYPQLKKIDITLLLPPIEELIDSAVHYSAMIHFWQHDIERNESKVKTSKRQWSRHIGLNTDYLYGNYQNYSLSDEGSVVVAPELITQNRNTFRVGAYIRFPLFDIINRNNNIQFSKIEKEQAEDKLSFQIEQIRQDVISRYYEVVMYYNLLQIQNDYLYTSMMQFEMAQRQFYDGQIQVSELSRLTEINTRAKSSFEQQKIQFQTSYRLLQEVTGVKLKSILIE